MEKLVTVSSLFKSYGKKEVLKDISFEIERGQIVGLLGPNGCGKTTLLKILTGLINDYTGEIRIDGESLGVHTKNVTAFLPERSYIPAWMSPKQTVDYYGSFYEDFDKNKALDLLMKMEIDAKQPLKTMSKGQREKVNLILVISRRAKFYVFDEPFGGVDPAAREHILNFIIENKSENSTILMSTHLISDVEKAFDRVLMIRDGHMLFDSFVDDIRQKGQSVEEVFKEVYRNAW